MTGDDNPFNALSIDDPAVVCVVPRDWRARLAHEDPDLAARSVSWEQDPGRRDVRRVALLDDYGSGDPIPEWVLELPEIDQALVPMRLAGQLAPCASRLTGSLTIEGHDGPNRLTCAFPRLTSLIAAANTHVVFEPEQLPVLTGASVSVDAKGEVLGVLGRMPRLERVGLFNVRTRDRVLSRLAPLPHLAYLKLTHGDLTALGGIGSLRSLTELALHQLRHLRDITALGDLPAIQRLTLWDTPAVDIRGAMTALARLRALRMVMCGDVGLDPVDQDRLAETIAELDLGASSFQQSAVKRAKRAQRAADAAKRMRESGE